MNPISLTSPFSPTPYSNTAAMLSAAGDPVASTFEELIDQLVLSTAPRSSASVSQTAIEAQEKVEDFMRKLALLTGMMEQAQIAMNAQKPLPGGLPNLAAQEYYFVRSELARVGLPGAVPEVV
jgi:ABC-type transporter Mla subunit MlaD